MTTSKHRVGMQGCDLLSFFRTDTSLTHLGRVSGEFGIVGVR